MKNFHSFILRSMMVLAALCGLWACSEDDEPDVVMIDFSSATLEVPENNDGVVSVNLRLSGTNATAGEITIGIINAEGTIYGTHYTTNPDGSSGTMTIAVPAQATSLSFGFTPLDNINDETNREVTFTITAASEGFTIGTGKSLQLTILDDELFQPVSIAFAATTGQLLEFATEPFELAFALGATVEGPGTFTVLIDEQSGATSNDYTSDPAVSGGEITGNVNTGDETAVIIINAIDNQVDTPDKKLVFTLTNATGGLILAQEGLTFDLTIVDDDESGPIEVIALETAYTKTEGGTAQAWFEPREEAQTLVELVEETDLGGETVYGDAYFRFDLSQFVINPDNISKAEFIFNFPLWDPFRNGGELNPSVRFIHDIFAFEFENDWDQNTDIARVSLNIISADTISQSPNKVVTTEKYKAKDDPDVIRPTYEQDRILTITDFIKTKVQAGETNFTIGLRKIEAVVDNKSRTFKIAGPAYKNENDQSVLRPKIRIE